MALYILRSIGASFFQFKQFKFTLNLGLGLSLSVKLGEKVKILI